VRTEKPKTSKLTRKIIAYNEQRKRAVAAKQHNSDAAYRARCYPLCHDMPQ